MKPGVRRLTAQEVPDLLHLWSLTDLPLRPCGRDHPDSLQTQMNNGTTVALGVRKDNSLIAAVLLTHDGRRGWIHHLAVHPKSRRRRLGSLLVKEGEEVLKGLGLQIVGALVERDNRASLALFGEEGYEAMDGILYLRKTFREGA